MQVYSRVKIRNYFYLVSYVSRIISVIAYLRIQVSTDDYNVVFSERLGQG